MLAWSSHKPPLRNGRRPAGSWALLVSLLLFGCERAEGVAPTASSAASAAPSGGASSPARSVPPLFGDGWVKAFQLRLSSSSELPGQTAASGMQVTGRLWLSTGSDGLRAVLEAPVGEVNGQADPAFQGLVAQMAEGVSLRFEGGALTAIFVPDVAPEVANFWRTIGAALQHSGAAPTSGEWTAREFDSTGEYEAVYRWETDSLVRSKRKYSSVLQTGAELATLEQLEPVIVEAIARLRLAGGRIDAVSSREVVRANLQKGVTMTVTTALSLSAAPGDPGSEVAPKALTALGAKALRELPSDRPLSLRSVAADRAQFDELKMKEWTFERAVAEVAGIDELEGARAEDNAARQQVYSAFSALTAYLRSRPETLPKAKKLVRDGAPAAPSVISALGIAATVPAQSLLVELALSTKVPGELRSRSIVAVTQCDDPKEGIVQALLPLLEERDLWSQTLLGLGSLGRRLRDAGRTAEFDEVSRLLGAQLTRFANDPRLTKVLSAVSNLGDARLLAEVRPFLTTSDERVRAEAVFALRHMQSPEVDPIIAAALTAKGSRATRLMILSAARVRGPLPMHREALRVLLQESDLDGQVRSRATQLDESWSRVATN